MLRRRVRATVGVVAVLLVILVIGAGCGGEEAVQAGADASARVSAEASDATKLALRASDQASLDEATASGIAEQSVSESNAAFEGAQSSGDPAELRAAERAKAYSDSAEVAVSSAGVDRTESDAIDSAEKDAVCSFALLALNNQPALTPQQVADGLVTDLHRGLGDSVPLADLAVMAVDIRGYLDRISAEVNSLRQADPTNWRWYVQQLQFYWHC